MIERIARRPLLLGAALFLSAMLGAAAFALILWLMPGGMDRARIERVAHAWLLEHPEVLVEAMDRLRARENAEAEQKASATVAAEERRIVTPFPGALAGNPRGDVSVVAFLDYACGYCRANLPAIAELIRRDPQVRIVYREYPVLGDGSVLAARWALAAAEQGRFAAFHTALYAGERLSQESLDAAIAAAGLDRARAERAVASRAVENELVANRTLGQRLNMTGTPAWVIGRRVYHGVLTPEELERAVAEARAET